MKKRTRIITQLHLACLCICTSLHAQQANLLLQQKDSISTTTSIELSPATIRSAKTPLLSEKNKTSIGKAAIEKANNTQDIPYLLNQFSSVVVNSDAGTGTGYTGIRVRGTDLTRINVSMNGIPVNDPESQNTFFVNLPDALSSANEVQLTKGVGSSKSGVTSFGASIAIQNLDVENTNPYVQCNTEYGSFNTGKVNVKASTGLLHKKFITTVRLSQIKSDGYIQRSSSNLRGLQLSAQYRLTTNSKFTFNYLQGREKTGQAWYGVSQDSLKTNRQFNELGYQGNGNYYTNQTDNYGQDYYQLFYDNTLNDAMQIGGSLFYTRGKGYYEEYKQAQAYKDYFLPDLLQGNDTIRETDLIRQLWLSNHYVGGRLHMNYFSSKINAGIYLQYLDYFGQHFGEVIWAKQIEKNNYRWYNLDARKTEKNIYGMAEFRLNSKFILMADIQLRQVHYTINGFRLNPTLEKDIYFLFANPKLKFSYNTKQSQASVVFGIANKEPNREDIEASTLTQPTPERLYDVEINYSRLIKSNFVVHATAFYMLYKNQLVLTGKLNDVGAYTRMNTPSSKRIGIETDITWKPFFSWLEYNGSLSISSNTIRNFTGYIDDYDLGGQISQQYRNTQISFSPSLILGSQFALYPFKKCQQELFTNWHTSFIGKYVGKQYLDNTASEDRKLDPFYQLDVIAFLPFTIHKNYKCMFRAGVINITNHLFEANGYTFRSKSDNVVTSSNYYFPQAGRRYTIGLGITL